ncbi:phosphodiester glycosidase family protein [Rapidithrix thailandica]|uniref:Phosphodiester glycosidase family protein n=1 Tax=Rapidithrix thailandica TaxID=413964 RepID=A0AAW9SDL4_9BACT
MKLLKIQLLLLLAGLLSLNSVYAQAQKIKWGKEKIAKGLIWKHAYLESWNGTSQNINLLEVNLKKRKVKLVYNPEENVITSQMAKETEAIAAVNAGFFDMRNGGSVTYIKVDGKILDKDTVGKWQPHDHLNGALLIDQNNAVSVAQQEKDHRNYNQNPNLRQVLVTGPVLIDDAQLQNLENPSKFVQNRHPRTCACTVKNKLYLITIDGRAEEASGMTLPELQKLLVALGCNEAINLDGGGSTTMWIKDQPDNGVVNMPSDNKKFDHRGERKVSNILIVH